MLRAAGAEKPIAIDSVVPNQNTKTHAFTQQLAVALKTPPPAPNELANQSKWSVTITSRGGTQTLLKGIASGWRVVNIGADGTPISDADGHVIVQDLTTPAPEVWGNSQIVLTLPSSTISADTSALTVSFAVSQALWTPSPPDVVSPTGLLSAGADKNKSDLYLSGLYSPAINSAPQYTIDAKARLVKQIGLSHWRLGGMALVSADKRPEADPDSFLVSGVAEWIAKDQRFLYQRAEGVLLDWNFAGLEFDRKTTNETFVSRPMFEMPLRLYPAPKNSGKFTLGMIPFAGVEFGDNLTNSVSSDGSGAVFRGVAGSTLDWVLKPGLSYLSKVSISTNYTVRLPAFDEVFTLTKMVAGKSVDVPMLSSQARHHLTSELDFTIIDPVSFAIKYEYGDLPPAFRFIDHKVSVGLTVMFQQNNSGRAVLEAQPY